MHHQWTVRDRVFEAAAERSIAIVEEHGDLTGSQISSDQIGISILIQIAASYGACAIANEIAYALSEHLILGTICDAQQEAKEGTKCKMQDYPAPVEQAIIPFALCVLNLKSINESDASEFPLGHITLTVILRKIKYRKIKLRKRCCC
jgi:hypothetical protein